MKKYNLLDDIDQIKVSIAGISELAKTRETIGWIQTVEIFQGFVSDLIQDVVKRAIDDPVKHALEIKCKSMVAEGLGVILSTLDSRVKNRETLREQLKDKIDRYNEAIKFQQQQQP